MQHFWDLQHQAMTTTVAQQKLRPKTRTNIPLFTAVLQQVHSLALKRILKEHSKLPATSPPLASPVCECTIQRSHSLPCYHTIWERISNGGVILLSDIHRHWHYERPILDVATSTSTTLPTPPPPSRPILNPVRLRGKGRPRGALGGVLRIAESSTRRLPSSFELPPSTAPAVLEGARSPVEQIFVVHSGLHTLLNRPTSTSLTMARLEAGHTDQYKPGTRGERGYMGGISSVYKDDSLDASAIAGAVIQREVIGGIEVHSQDAEFDLDDL